MYIFLLMSSEWSVRFSGTSFDGRELYFRNSFVEHNRDLIVDGSKGKVKAAVVIAPVVGAIG
jgi:hypothetical protein